MCKGQGWKSILNDCDLWGLGHDSVMDITARAQECFKKSMSLNTKHCHAYMWTLSRNTNVFSGPNLILDWCKEENCSALRWIKIGNSWISHYSGLNRRRTIWLSQFKGQYLRWYEGTWHIWKGIMYAEKSIQVLYMFFSGIFYQYNAKPPTTSITAAWLCS